MAHSHEIIRRLYLAISICCLIICLSGIVRNYIPEKAASREGAETFDHQVNEILANSEFRASYEPSNFCIDDTEKLMNLRGVIASLPELWGYSEARGNEIFPPFIYPKCESLHSSNRNNTMNFNVKAGLFSMSCPDMSQAVYFLGPDARVRFTNSYQMEKQITIQNYTRKVKLEPYHEWVLASCKGGIDGFEMFDMKPRYKPNKSSTSKKSKNKPMTIAMITLDSFSRRHFFRKLPKTVELLNSIQSGREYEVKDLKIHNIQGWDTARNQARVFGEAFPGFVRNPRLNDRFGTTAIWNLLREEGFTTLLGFEACAVKMHKMLGMRPLADHVVNPFYCAASQLTNYSSYKHSTKVQRCIGPYMSHYYLMKYSLDFSEMYSARNQWIYNHFTAAHEYTGQHAATLDDDLVWYIQELFKISQKNGRELVIFLGGDHGMRYGNFMKDPEAIQEFRLCAMFVISSHSLLMKMENSYSILEHNSKRLTTKGDLRRTVLELAKLQNGIKQVNYTGSYYNIFQDYVIDSRTCSDAMINREFCSDNVLYNLPRYYFDPREYQYKYRNSTEIGIGSLILHITRDYIEMINSNNYTPKKFPKGYICQKLTLDEISVVMTEQQVEVGSIVMIAFIVNQSEKAEFNIWLKILDNFDVTKVNLYDEGDFLFGMINGVRVRMKVLKMVRTDRYQGPCEKLATLANLDPESCICNPDRFLEAEWNN